MMTRGPEEIFDEAFANCNPEDQKHYKGRHDLSGLPPEVQRQLRLIQAVFNGSLQNEKFVPEHVTHPPFHVDYVKSDVQNALAFRYDGYSFIGITVPLIYAVSHVCLGLSKSPTVSALLRVQLSDEDYNKLHAALFFNLVAFIVAHEFTHHVHGHVCTGVGTVFANEILDTARNGNLRWQIQEVAADGYSIYHVLANLFAGGRATAVTALGLESEDPGVRDEVLLSLVVIAVGAYLFVRPLPTLNEINVYAATHPPQAARMDCIMQEAMNWCGQNKPPLQSWMTPPRFQELMDAATEATLGMSGAQVAGGQAAFLQSEAGKKYRRALADGVNAYKQAL
jgi:hypothetical protein